MKKEKIAEWIKKHKRVLKAAVMALLPVLCCLVTCAVEGRSLGQIYLPASEWNDELIYYKQVEGIVKYGYPYGYFGFNESHSQMFSFAAWSPVLVWPWILWGLLFGWNLMSPVICNIVLMSIAVFLFVWFVKPTGKQMGILAVLFVTFTPFTRYMLSCMPEIICFSMVIVVLGLGISYLERETKGKLIALFVLTALMTWMRPYLLVFMLLPVFFWIRRNKWWGVLGSLAVFLVTGAVYIFIKKNLSAEYFLPLFKTDFIDAFRYNGLLGCIKHIVYQLLVKGKEFMAMAVEGYRSGLAAGAYFDGFMLVLGILVIQCVHNYRKKQTNQLIINGYLTVCFAGMWAALLVMYKLIEGSKHLITFMAVGIFAISLMETKFYKKMIVCAAVFVYLYAVLGANHPYDFANIYQEESLVADVEQWQAVLEEELVLSVKEDTPNFDNVVIWTLYDYMTEDGTQVMTRWQPLYGVPAGFGINCCYPEYVVNNFDTLQSKYVWVTPGGTVEQYFTQKGVDKIYETGDLILYRLR